MQRRGLVRLFGKNTRKNGSIGECCNGYIDHVDGHVFRWAEPRAAATTAGPTPTLLPCYCVMVSTGAAARRPTLPV